MKSPPKTPPKAPPKAPPKTLAELPRLFQEALCCYEAYRRLGIPAKDIFLVVTRVENASNPDLPSIVVKAQDCNGVEFLTRIGFAILDSAVLTPEEIQTMWKTACDLFIYFADEADGVAMWGASEIRQRFVELAMAMKAQGMRLPVLES